MMQGAIKALRAEKTQSDFGRLQEQLQRDIKRLEQLREKKLEKPDKRWESCYQMLDNIGEEEEIQIRIGENEKKLASFAGELSKGKNEMTEGAGLKLCCKSSQSRHSERRIARMPLREQITTMKSFRIEFGNRCFRKAQYEVALQWYTKSLLVYEYCFPSNPSEKQEVDEERHLCLLNSAACHLTTGNNQACIECCSEALEVTNGTCVKALFRRAKAYRRLSSFDDAKKDFEQVGKLTELQKASKKEVSESTQEAIHNERLELQKAIQSYNNDTKMLARKMMQCKM